MISIENVKTGKTPGWLRFDVRVVEGETEELQLVIKGCSVSNYFLNGPYVRIGATWVPVVEIYGALRSAIIKAMEPLKERFEEVKWPKDE